MKRDDLGNRMKENYENRVRIKLPRRTYTIIRLDGKAFHNFTKNFERPFDSELIDIMNKTAISLCKNIMGAKLAYVQSDEISILLTDFDSVKSSAWFDGNLQKIISISASIATAVFNKECSLLKKHDELAYFDSRAFTIPQSEEVNNYFIWRQQDCTRNSISMVAQSLYSHEELHLVSQNDLQEMIFQKGINWDKYPVHLKRGRCVVKQGVRKNSTIRNKWTIIDPPIFTQDRSFILKYAVQKSDNN